MTKKLSNENVFTEESYYARHHIKRRCIEEKLIPYLCAECANVGTHNGKILSLQLDHINGKAEDNRLENLRFLCPNCHSQTDTYAGKASTGKRLKMKKPDMTHKDKKKLNDITLWETLKHDSSIRYGEWGWKSRLCDKIGIKSQKVTPWLRRVDPEFLKFYENS